MKSNQTHTEELDLTNAPLGKKSKYVDQYTPDLLFPISRVGKRMEIGIHGSLPFDGSDIWNAFEISWLNLRGKPVVALGEFIVPCNSPNLIESKSFKLYLNSLNNSRFSNFDEVSNLLKQDLSAAAGAQVGVRLSGVNESIPQIRTLHGLSLDILDIDCDSYAPDTDLLTVSQEIVEEVLYSDLLKSNCLVTGQPDWGSVQIKYIGKKIDHEGLLRYIVSFRNHNEFHEQCVERIFVDITEKCRPEKLSVLARYTRRGGLDINPRRASHNFEARETALDNQRLVRQ